MSTCYDSVRKGCDDGTWQRRDGRLCTLAAPKAGKKAISSAAILDSEGVKTTEGGERGHDVFKVVTGRKRHVIVNTLGPPLAVVGTAADIRDRDGAKLVLAEVGTRSPRLG